MRVFGSLILKKVLKSQTYCSEWKNNYCALGLLSNFGSFCSSYNYHLCKTKETAAHWFSEFKPIEELTGVPAAWLVVPSVTLASSIQNYLKTNKQKNRKQNFQVLQRLVFLLDQCEHVDHFWPSINIFSVRWCFTYIPPLKRSFLYTVKTATCTRMDVCICSMECASAMEIPSNCKGLWMESKGYTEYCWWWAIL